MPGLNDFLSRIQTDYGFYLQFRQAPQEALADYDLSAEQRAGLIESGTELQDHLGRGVFPLTSHQNVVALGSTDPEFNPAAALSQPEVQQNISLISGAATHEERLQAILGLIEQIG
jgi:hypothetical protein